MHQAIVFFSKRLKQGTSNWTLLILLIAFYASNTNISYNIMALHLFMCYIPFQKNRIGVDDGKGAVQCPDSCTV